MSIHKETFGCWDGGPRDPCYRIWTIQTEVRWQESQRTGVLLADPKILENSRLGPAFFWLMEEMQNLQRPGWEYSGRCPVIGWQGLKPKLDWPDLLPTGTPGVRIECLISKKRVLLFHKDGWAIVKGRWYVPLNEEDATSFENETIGISQFEDLKDDRHETNQQERVVASWKRIFDFDIMENAGFDRDRVYAAFEELNLAEVVKIKSFIAV